jgi:hypothetical protein
MRASTIVAAAGLIACACATSGSAVTLTSRVNYGASPVRYSVGDGRISSEELSVMEDKGCVTGTFRSQAVQLCRDKVQPDGTQHWVGTSGEVVLKPLEHGKAWQVEGHLDFGDLTQGGWFDVSQTLRADTESKAFDDLRVQPELWLLASTATDLHAARRHHHI